MTDTISIGVPAALKESRIELAAGGLFLGNEGGVAADIGRPNCVTPLVVSSMREIADSGHRIRFGVVPFWLSMRYLYCNNRLSGTEFIGANSSEWKILINGQVLESRKDFFAKGF